MFATEDTKYWIAFEQDMAVIKSIISDIIIETYKHILEKNNLIVWFVAFSFYIKLNFLSVNERFEICTENKQSIF